MPTREEQHPENRPPYIDEGLIINTRLNEIERQQREEKAEEKEYKRRQLRFNWLMVIFTALLFLTSAVSDWLLLRQTSAARESADAAKDAAGTSANALKTAYRPRVIVQSPYPRDTLDTGRLAIGFKVTNYA